MRLFFILLVLLLFLPMIVSSATLRGDYVYLFPTTWEIRGVGKAIWKDGNLLISADVIIVNLLTKNIIAFGDVKILRDGKEEFYDVFSTKELELNLYETQSLPYIMAREIEINWRTTTITFKGLKVSQDITLSEFSIPFGPYSSGIKFSAGEEILSIDTSAPYISIILPYNGGIFTQVLTESGMEVFYEEEGYYLLGARAYIDKGMSIFGEYTLYSPDKSLRLTIGYDEIPYSIISKEIRNGIWKYTGEGRVKWKDKPEITLSLTVEQWDRMMVKGEIVYTEDGTLEFNPYIGYRFELSQDLSLNIYLSKIGLDSLQLTYRMQPAVNLKLGYVNPNKYILGVEWGYRGIELIDYNGTVSLIIR
ncbi:MAG: hypothetical protein N2380_04800 [bacterium]|nr:hypothetical protein [bacterium]